MPDIEIGSQAISNEQGIAAPKTASVTSSESSAQNPEKYWVKRWEGKDILTLPCTPSINSIQKLKISQAHTVFPKNELQSDWTRLELVFNNHKLRGKVVGEFLTCIETLLLSEMKTHTFESKEALKQFIADYVQEIKPHNLENLSQKLALIPDINNLEEKQQQINTLKDTLSADEINTVLNWYVTDINQLIDNASSENSNGQTLLSKYSLPKSKLDPNSIGSILNKISNILDQASNCCLSRFFHVEINKSNISNNHPGLEKSIISLMNQNGILFTAQNIFNLLFYENNQPKYCPAKIDHDNAKVIAQYDKDKNQIFVEVSMPVYSIAAYDGTSKAKYLYKGKNKLESITVGESVDLNQCEPLFILKVNQSFSPISGDDAEFNILSYEVSGINNFDLNNICCDSGLIPGFKNIIDELSLIDGTDSQAIINFIDNWQKYYQTTLVKDSSIRTNKPITTIGDDELLDTLQLTIELYLKTNPQALIDFNKKLGVIVENLQVEDTSIYLAALERLHALININITDIKLKYADSDKNNIFEKNVTRRNDKFRNFSSIIYSILNNINGAHLYTLDNVNDTHNYKKNIYSLVCDFTSLAFTIEKLKLTKSIKDLKDFLCLENYDASVLQAWKEFIKKTKRNLPPDADKEVLGYLEKGVEYFEALMTESNAFKSKILVGQYVTAIEQTHDESGENFKANMIINHLVKQRELPNYKLKGTQFSEKISDLEDLLYAEAVEEFKAGKTLKQVAQGEVGQLCDKTVNLINVTVSKKPNLIKKTACDQYKKETFWITAKPIFRAAIAAVAAAAVGFIGGISLFVGSVFSSGWFGYKAKKQVNEVAKYADKFIEPKSPESTRQPIRSPSMANN